MTRDKNISSFYFDFLSMRWTFGIYNLSDQYIMDAFWDIFSPLSGSERLQIFSEKLSFITVMNRWTSWWPSLRLAHIFIPSRCKQLFYLSLVARMSALETLIKNCHSIKSNQLFRNKYTVENLHTKTWLNCIYKLDPIELLKVIFDQIYLLSLHYQKLRYNCGYSMQ